ncbi:class I SAM-dependent RNA methyltransferase [Curvivirga sp.]|uniref:class I SAM-dependent RNA methyltransferase n=1 Tax=Curvivirga sp. TaxID=2856848 RepID=UPI003B5B7FB8
MPSNHNRRNRKSKKPQFTSHPVEVEITRLGAGGDGIATDDKGRTIYMPYSLPGEIAVGKTIAKRGEGIAAKLESIQNPSKSRVEQKCDYFGRCGGCSMQHMATDAIADWKRETLTKTLHQKGLDDFPVNPTKSVPAGTRRRARFAVKPTQNKCVFGFNSPFSKQIIDIETCPLLSPKLSEALSVLRHLSGSIEGFSMGGDVQATETQNGLDILFVPNNNGELTLQDRENLIEFANQHQVARIAWENDGWVEPVCALLPADIKFAHTDVAVPIGAFLQPSQAGQDILVELVCKAVGDAKKIADLYCGCGTFTLPLAALPQKPIVHAADGLEDQVSAMRKAVAGQKITVESVDLAKTPPSSEELNAFDAVVFDPPRAGAQRLAESLAWSNVETIVAVSCNPATLARDLRILVDGGYEIIEVTPVDQFTWSAHLEAVVVLKRESF